MLRYRTPALDGRAGAIDVGVSITYDDLHESPEIRMIGTSRMDHLYLLITFGIYTTPLVIYGNKRLLPPFLWTMNDDESLIG
jgi:hypothetical protein